MFKYEKRIACPVETFRAYMAAQLAAGSGSPVLRMSERFGFGETMLYVDVFERFDFPSKFQETVCVFFSGDRMETCVEAIQISGGPGAYFARESHLTELDTCIMPLIQWAAERFSMETAV